MITIPQANLDELIAFIKEHQGRSHKISVSSESLLENDLGITGDDGRELLEAIEKKFGVTFSDGEAGLRPAFGLSENEFLFHSEGFDIVPSFIKRLFGFKPEKIHPLTVGRLLEVIQQRQNLLRV